MKINERKPIIVNVQRLLAIVDAIDEFLYTYREALINKKGNLNTDIAVSSKLCDDTSMAMRFFQKWKSEPIVGEIWLALKKAFHLEYSDTLVLKTNTQSVYIGQFGTGKETYRAIRKMMV